MGGPCSTYGGKVKCIMDIYGETCQKGSRWKANIKMDLMYVRENNIDLINLAQSME